MRLIRRFWLPFLLLATLLGLWASGLSHLLNWSTLARHQAALLHWTMAHPLPAMSLYVGAYAVAAAVALPEAAAITLAGGLLFGPWLGGALAVAGSSAGGIILFLAIRHHLADVAAARGGQLLRRIRAALQRDGFSYLLAARLIPLFPFWLVNIAAGLSGMRLLPYATATVVGVMPAAFLYAWIGAGVGEVLAMGGQPELDVIFSPRMLAPLFGLAILALLPVVWRRWRGADA